MAKITVYIPEPKDEYDVSNQRQVLEALDTVNLRTNRTHLIIFYHDNKIQEPGF